MDINQLKYQILKDAEHQDLLPTTLINKYDVALDGLMEVLKSLLNDGSLVLSDKKWLRITEKGLLSLTEVEEIAEEEYERSSYFDEFFSRSNTVLVNEPCLPSLEGCKKIMEGESHKETSN